MRTLSRLVVLALVALALPASASAADPWSVPAPIRAQATTPPLSGAAGLAANESGRAIAVADTAASVFADGAFSDPARLTPTNVEMGPGNGRVLPYAQTRLIGTGIRRATSSSQAVVAFGRIAPTGATLDAPRGLGPPNLHAARAAMAVNAKGDAAIVFPVCRDAACTKVLVYLAVRAAGTSTFRSTRLADGSGPLPQVAAAINDRGDAMAVWTQANTLYARIRTAGGTLRPRQRVGPTIRGQHLAPSAQLSLHRGQLVGWLAQAVGEANPSAGTAWAAQARDGGSFTATRLGDIPDLDDGHYVSEAGVRVGYGAQSRSLVAWTGYENGRFVVRRAQIRGAANSTTQSLIDVATISQPGIDTVLSDFLVDASGAEHALMLAGARGSDSSSPTGLTVRASGDEEVSATVGPGAQPRDVDGVLLPDGRVLAAWTTVSEGDLWSVRAAPTTGS